MVVITVLNFCIISGLKAQLCLIYEIHRSIPKILECANRSSEKSVCFIRVFECNTIELPKGI